MGLVCSMGIIYTSPLSALTTAPNLVESTVSSPHRSVNAAMDRVRPVS